MERINEIEYIESPSESTVEGKETLFVTGPAEFLCQQVALMLLEDPVWAKIFGPNIDPYKRMDYPIRAFPALRIFSDRLNKDDESWFVTGNLTMDIILPASLRRKELQQLPDTISAALLQQFRRTSFFNAVSARVPGLNELGKRFEVEKEIGFQMADDEEICPLVRITANFRLDLRVWDDYLTSDNRTKDDPYERTLVDLEQICFVIQALRDDLETELTIYAGMEPGSEDGNESPDGGDQDHEGCGNCSGGGTKFYDITFDAETSYTIDTSVDFEDSRKLAVLDVVWLDEPDDLASSVVFGRQRPDAGSLKITASNEFTGTLRVFVAEAHPV